MFFSHINTDKLKVFLLIASLAAGPIDWRLSWLLLVLALLLSNLTYFGSLNYTERYSLILVLSLILGWFTFSFSLGSNIFSASSIALLLVFGSIVLAVEWRRLSDLLRLHENFAKACVLFILVIALGIHLFQGRAVFNLKETISAPLILIGFLLWKNNLHRCIFSILAILSGAKLLIISIFILGRSFATALLMSGVILVNLSPDRLYYVLTTLETPIVNNNAEREPSTRGRPETINMRKIESEMFWLELSQRTNEEILIGKGLDYELKVPPSLIGVDPFVLTTPGGGQTPMSTVRYLHNSLYFLISKVGILGATIYLVWFGYLALRPLIKIQRSENHLNAYLFGIFGFIAWLTLYMGIVNLPMCFILLMAIHWLVTDG